MNDVTKPQRDALLARIKWRLDHYGPLYAEPFQYSRYASPAHAALSAVEESGWRPPSTPTAESDDDVATLACYDCGLPYGGPGWSDCHIPDETWLCISPTGHEGGVLCLNCI